MKIGILLRERESTHDIENTYGEIVLHLLDPPVAPENIDLASAIDPDVNPTLPLINDTVFIDTVLAPVLGDQ